MNSTARTVTVVGLSLRDETMVRSLVDAGRDRHGEVWRFVDELEADVALCAPDSPLTRIALARRRQSGAPRCVRFGEAADGRAEGSHATDGYDATLRLPLRMSELWRVLESLAAPEGGAAREGTHDAAPFARADLVGLALPHVVSALAADYRGRDERWRLRLGGFVLEVRMPARTIEVLSRECTFDALLDVVCASKVDAATVVPDVPSGEESPGIRSLDALLWRVGLRDEAGTAGDWARENTPVALRRWPDFGHLGAHRPHLTMTSLLTRRAHTVAELAAGAGSTPEQAIAFLNACALLGLVRTEQSRLPAPHAVEPRQRGLSKLMRSFRAALGIGD